MLVGFDLALLGVVLGFRKVARGGGSGAWLW